MQSVRADEKKFKSKDSSQFHALLNDAPLGVYVVDSDFRLCQANPIALSAFGNIPNLLGRDFDEIMHILWPKKQADEIVKQFRHTLKTGEAYSVSELVEQ